MMQHRASASLPLDHPNEPEAFSSIPSRPSSTDILQRLREVVGAIERRPPALDGAVAPAPEGVWTLGVPDLDGCLGPLGLDCGGVHEIKPAVPVPAAGSWPSVCAAARRFALGLAVRRLASLPADRQGAPLLLCTSRHRTAELGTPFGPGLAALGVDPARLILVEPHKPADVLWAIEEGLRSAGLALVVGEIDDAGLTPARRLALAAERGVTPCLLLTHPHAGGIAATASRWRIASGPSAPHALDPTAPGTARLHVSLERCRGSPVAPRQVPFLLEWCDAAYRFRVAASLADRAPGTRLPAGGPRWALDAA